MSRRGTAAEVDRAISIARAEGLSLAADWIAEQRHKRWPGPEPWDLGPCIWCEVDAGKRRKATVTDPGGGPPMCHAHFDQMTETPSDFQAGEPI